MAWLEKICTVAYRNVLAREIAKASPNAVIERATIAEIMVAKAAIKKDQLRIEQMHD